MRSSKLIPRRRKKSEARKVKEEGGEKVKRKSQDCSVTLINSINYLKNFAFSKWLNFGS